LLTSKTTLTTEEQRNNRYLDAQRQTADTDKETNYTHLEAQKYANDTSRSRQTDKQLQEEIRNTIHKVKLPKKKLAELQK